MIFLLSFFWYIRTKRALLFSLYLWQLKEYHIGRFLAHFSTAKGRRLFLHPFVAVKFALFAFWFFKAELAVILLLLFYVGETVLFFNTARKKNLLSPVITRKTFVLIVSIAIVQVMFLAVVFLFFFEYAVPAFLAFDLFSLLIGSIVVLAWQPYTIFERKRFLQKATDKREKLKNLKVVGITGSYGKTSTKEFLAHILGKKFVVLKTPEHKNSEMGIAHTILYDLTDEHQIFVCEMGAYNRGGIKLLSNMVKPDMGIVTGVNEQHLGIFGSKANLFSAEGGGELVASLSKDSILILNDDSTQLHELGPWLQLWNSNFTNYVWCSTKTQKNFFAKDIVVEKRQISFTFVTEERQEKKVVLPLIGEHNVENILLATAAAIKLGMEIEDIVEALKDVPQNISAVHLFKGKNEIEILDSSYSANPAGVFSALGHLKFWQGKKILVIPSLIELGSASHKLHVEIGQKIAETCDMAFITTSDEFSALLKGAKEKGMKEENMILLENPEEITQKILGVAKKGDIVLLEGRVPAAILSLLKI